MLPNEVHINVFAKGFGKGNYSEDCKILFPYKGNHLLHHNFQTKKKKSKMKNNVIEILKVCSLLKILSNHRVGIM